MRLWSIVILALFLWTASAVSVTAGDNLQYDGWFRWGYNEGTRWGDLEVSGDDFYWGRVNFYGELSKNISYYLRFQGIQLNNPLGEPFEMRPLWYYLSFMTSAGRFDLGRQAILPTVNEELIFELNGLYGTTLAYYPTLPEGFSGSLAVTRHDDMVPLGSHLEWTAQFDYIQDKWSIGFNYFDQKNLGVIDDPMMTVELSFRYKPGWSINFELGRNVVYMPENPVSSGLYGDDVALVGLRYADPRWNVFAGYNFPVEHYALDVLYMFNHNWGLRAEYNNSFVNYSPGFQVSLYYMFASAK